jgi:2-haloacid dehalogenase
VYQRIDVRAGRAARGAAGPVVVRIAGMSLRALVFDAYGTLFDVLSVQARAEAMWPGRGDELSRLWRSKQLEYTWQRGLMQRYAPFSQVTRDALVYACEALQLALDEAKTDSLLKQYARLAAYPDVPAALERLKGRRLAILTNGSPDMIEPHVRNSGMEQTFDAVLSVDALKLFKPAPQVYEFAADRLGVEPSETGFVSSNCWDAIGAKSFGFRVWWINRGGMPVDRTGFRPDAILGGLGELPALIDPR